MLRLLFCISDTSETHISEIIPVLACHCLTGLCACWEQTFFYRDHSSPHQCTTQAERTHITWESSLIEPHHFLRTHSWNHERTKKQIAHAVHIQLYGKLENTPVTSQLHCSETQHSNHKTARRAAKLVSLNISAFINNTWSMQAYTTTYLYVPMCIGRSALLKHMCFELKTHQNSALLLSVPALLPLCCNMVKDAPS